MREFLAVDAGGTSTRAVVVDEAGRCRGYGRSSGGNPTSAGLPAAAAAVAAAARAALEAAGSEPASMRSILLAHAGASGDGFRRAIGQQLAASGFRGSVDTTGDLLALFASGTPETHGAALIAGTGAIGGAVQGGAIARLVDGTGWLLGDAGSGFWIGHRVARAVTDDLDGGAPTRLTAALLARLGLDDDDRTLVDGRPRVLGRLILNLYELRPVQLSALAPLAFEHAASDDVAARIVGEAVAALAVLLRRVRRAQAQGPLVFGGSVLVQGCLRLEPSMLQPLLDEAGGTTPIPVADGLVGAAVLAVRAGGVPVGPRLFASLSTGVRAAGDAFAALPDSTTGTGPGSGMGPGDGARAR